MVVVLYRVFDLYSALGGEVNMGAANLLPVGGAVGGGLPGLAGSRKSTPVCLFVVPGRGTRGIDTGERSR